MKRPLKLLTLLQVTILALCVVQGKTNTNEQKQLLIDNANEVKQWFESENVIKVTNNIKREGPIKDIYYSGSNTDTDSEITELTQRFTIVAQLNRSDEGVIEGLYWQTIVSKQDAHYKDGRVYTHMHFLKWSKDKAVYMRLDQEKFGPMFMTSELTGCEVWLVCGHGKDEPYVIHINANKLKTNSKTNSKSKIASYKEEVGIKVLERIRSQHYRIERVFRITPKGVKMKKKKVLEKIHVYQKTYKGKGFFYGTYAIKSWTFVLKDKKKSQRIDCQSYVK